MGLFLVGILFFGGTGILWATLRRIKEKPVPPAFVAAAFLALPYAHFALSRADVDHLAQGIFPLLVGCFVLLSTREASLKWSLAVALCVASLWVMYPFHPGWECRNRNQCVDVEISSSDVRIERSTANQIALIRELADRYAPNGQTFITAPFWVAAYPLLERRSPMWEIYPLFPRSETFERREIERIKASKPGFAIIEDVPLDGRNELRFRNTHPLIHRYILENFEAVPNPPSPAYQIYKAKNLAP